jgi:hypothetical protein
MPAGLLQQIYKSNKEPSKVQFVKYNNKIVKKHNKNNTKNIKKKDSINLV